MKREFGRRLEDWFQEDFSNVKVIVFTRRYPGLWQTPVAWAASESIYLSDTLAGWDEKTVESVLVHEFTHVVQKRRRQTGEPASGAILEAEADRTAIAFLSGRKCPPLSFDSESLPRPWGPAGHFYTVYWVSRHAGVEDSTAERLAFYAQMPDQVSDFDAKLAGIKWAKTASLPPEVRKKVVGNEDRFDASIYQVQAGLHCLNGRDGKAESARRDALLRKLPKNQFLAFSFGLGLHALGDSYAHRNRSGSTFVAPIGHGFAGDTIDEKYVKLGTEIDNINKHQDSYREYCEQMFRVIADSFSEWSPEDHKARRVEFGRKIARVVEKTSEQEQIGMIQQFDPDRRSYYAPEKHQPMPWARFRMLYPSLTQEWMLEKGQALAEAWTLSPG